MTRRTSSALDLLRQLFVTLAAVVMLVGALLGSGLVSQVPVLKDLPWLHGVPVDKAANGWFAPGMTLLAPSRSAWWIWPVIYAGLLGYTAWQWLGEHSDDPRYRGSGWWLGLAMVGVGTWTWVAEQGWLWGSVAVMLAVVVCSYLGVVELGGHSSSRSLATTLMSDVGPGLLLGWTSVALMPNILSAAGAGGFRPGGWLGAIVAVGMLLVSMVLSGCYLRWAGPRITVAAGMCWGLSWIAWARIVEKPYAPIVGWSSVGVAIMVAFLTIGALIHVPHD